MDTELARTFLEIVSTGSFVRAAERLHVSQTAISARIRSLETQLGRPVFLRNKAGAALTPAGEKFLRYAPTIIQMWERARQDIAVPPGRRALLAIGGELALWNPLLLNWLLWLRESASDVALRAQVATQETLTRQVAEGVLDLAIMYAPQILPGLTVEQVLDEKLVLVTTDPAQSTTDDAGYVYIDWGPEFAMQHGVSFPDRASPTLLMGLGPLGLSYILDCGGSGYFRMSSVRPYLVSGRLSLVADAPEFPYPAYVVYATRGNLQLLEPALNGLRHVAGRL
jgi:LysR family transcriptional regulator, flagellar master operon regulator